MTPSMRMELINIIIEALDYSNQDNVQAYKRDTIDRLMGMYYQAKLEDEEKDLV